MSMEMTAILIAGLALILTLIVVFFYAVGLYNNLVHLKGNVKEAWSNIDVTLKQRHDELPKLIEVCKQYMDYEKGTLQQITQARSAVEQARASNDVTKLGVAETLLRKSTGGLFAVAENYPDLKANASFQQLQNRISTLETTISDRRELYNNSANLFNIRIKQFPDVIIASLLNFNAVDLLTFSKTEIQDVAIKAAF